MYKSMFVLLISPDAANNLLWTLKLSQCGGEENFWEAVSEKNDQLGTALEVEVKVLVEEKNRCIAQRLKKIRRDHHISRILHPIGAVAREIGKGKKICLLKNNGK